MMWPPIQSGLLVDEDDELFCGEHYSVARAIAECVDLRELCSANLPKAIKASPSSWGCCCCCCSFCFRRTAAMCSRRTCNTRARLCRIN
mmetsp:Transcript_16619/g.21283  ORF Transcript_16619/g.21283 Transcript_16619/m.21283 type:complete len:89 (+) Transcript_16619:80-346(+)